MILASVLLIAAVLVSGLTVFFYNQLKGLRTMVQEGWRGIEAQFDRRADLIPDLIETARRYMGPEHALLKQVSELRSRSLRIHDMPHKQAMENELTGGLARLFAMVERYPDLRADNRFQALQCRLAEIEDRLQLARRYYNARARDLNLAIVAFPGNLLARWLAFEPALYFEFVQPSDLPPVADDPQDPHLSRFPS